MDLHVLAADLQAEHDDLAALLAQLPDAAFDCPTPAEGWLVRDQLTHLAYFDRIAVLAMTDVDQFAALRAQVIDDIPAYVEAALAEGRGLDGRGLLDWFARERSALVAALDGIDPRASVPWFGPPMTPASKGTARIMETWAHGQDIVDALGLERAATPRLRHVAHISVRARPNSYRTRGLPVPDADVRVELRAPDGSTWTWGDPAAAGRVDGDALEFCLVATQRRNLDDTALVVTGPVAAEWMRIAQAFAGPPGPGRAPGFGRDEADR